MEAVDASKAPKGATHRYEHGGLISWCREIDGKLFVWRDGSWHGAVYKSTEQLMNSCMLGRVTLLAMEQAEPADDDLTWLALNLPRWMELPGATHIARDKLAGHVFGFFSHEPQQSAARNWFTKDQYLARRAELQNKPSWADAPEWAEWLAQHASGYWAWGCGNPAADANAWKGVGEDWEVQWSGCAGEVLGDWRDTLERRPAESITIDWSTAPAGATHHIGGGKLECPWHQNFSHIRYWNGERWVKRSAFRTLDEAVAKGFAVVARPADIEQKAQEAADLALKAATLLRENPGLFSANELAEMHQLCDAELTKRDAAVCGGQKYLDAHWFERRELPPVGVVCEAATEGCKYERCEILAYHKGQVALRWFEFNEGRLDVLDFDGWSFRPIRPDRDVLIGIIKATDDTDDKIADAILAAGFKRGEV